MDMEKEYYWDVFDRKLTERREKDLRFGYLIIILYLISVTFLNLPNLVYSSQKNIHSFFMAIFIWLAMCGVVIWFLRDTYIMSLKAALINGIKLTSKELVIYDNKYPLSSVVYSEVVEFMGTQGLSEIFNLNADKWLCIAIRNKKGKIKFHLLRYNETTDIQKLSNLIRQLKGLPVQREIKSYGSYVGYYKWKKEVLKMLEGRIQ